jgi:hypothetical protein
LIKAAGGEHATLESYRIAVRQRRDKKWGSRLANCLP